MTHKNKILIVGDFNGHIRSQFFVHRLLKKELGSNSNFTLSFANPSAYKLVYKRFKLLEFLLNSFFSLFFTIELFVKMAFCDKVYFLAMNHMIFPKVLLANFFWKKKIIADMYISIYDAIDNRNLFRGSFLKRLLRFRFKWYFKLLDRLLIEKPDKTIYIGDLELKFIAKLVNADLSKSDYVIIPPSSLPKRKAIPKESEIFRICWWGTFTPFHGIDNIIETANLLKQENFKFSLNLFGTPKDNINNYIKIVDELKLTDKVFFHIDKTFSNKLLEEYLYQNCDLALGNFSTTERAYRAVPTKIFDAFSMSLPTITMDTDVLRDSVDVDNELFITTNNPKDISNRILEISSNNFEIQRVAENGYKRFQKSFSKNVVQEQFINLFKI
jgi:glycosyltransferase involved in cell wall biosynthesis